MSNQVEWGQYPFHVCNYKSAWSELSGVYIFTGLNQHQFWVPLYIGETENFRQRFQSHERWLEAEQRGATHVHALVVRPEVSRVAIQDQLIRTYRPTLNTQGLRTRWGA